MHFRILGPLQVVDGDTPVEIAGTKRRAVLALLLLHANEVVRTERLIDDLWGERAPQNATAALHSHVSRLRKALGSDVLARREWGYVLRIEEDSIDLRRYEQLIAAAEPLPARERAAKLTEALRLWRGPALADLASEPGLQPEIARLDELRVTTVERRIDADLEAGCSAELVGEIEALIAAHPLREHLRGQLILALYRAGRQAEALEVFRETRRVLTEELGLEPSPALKELERAILRQDPAIAAAPRPASPASAVPEAPRRRRRVLLTMIVLGALGLGFGAAFAVVGVISSHGTLQAASVTPSSTGNTVPLRTDAAQGKARGSTSTAAQSTSAPTRAKAQTTASTVAHEITSQRRRRAGGLIARPTTRTADGTLQTRSKRTVRTTTRPIRRQHATRAKGPKPKPVRISDTFDDNSFDGTIWYAIRSGTGWEDAVRNGRVEFSFDADAQTGGDYNRVGGHYGTQCKFPGDFDARVDFALPTWPVANGVTVALWAFFTNRGYSVARTSSPQFGEYYSPWLGIVGNYGVPLADGSGSLRLARRNGVLTTYFWHKGTWRKLESRPVPGLATIAIGADAGDDFAGKPVLVAFDNFDVAAADARCPPGSDPRDP